MQFIGCWGLVLSMSLISAFCPKKSATAPRPVAAQSLDHFVGTWKLNKDKTHPVTRFASNPIPVYEWIVIMGVGDRFTVMFSHFSDKPWEMDRVFFTDMRAPATAIDSVTRGLMMYTTYLHRIDADTFTQGSGISENEYTVLPDLRTMKVKQFPLIDNGFERHLVYEKVAPSAYVQLPRF